MAEVKLTITGEDKSQPVQAGLKATEAAISAVKTAAAALGVSLGAVALVGLVKDSIMMAARYETLGVTMRVVGNNAGYTGQQMEGFQASLQKSGIAMIEARQNLTMMAQAHINLANSAQLARIAQDAAVIGGINSSEAFSRMIYGIQSGQTEVLRTIGINVNFEESYKKLSKQLGKNTDDLTEMEKAQARTNAVMDKGKDIAGAYEAAMGTAGKQITSMKRYLDNLKVMAGEVFQDALVVAVNAFTGGLKEANTEAEKLQNEGKTKAWAKDIVMGLALAADAVKYTTALIATFTGTAVAGLMQVYKVGEAAYNLSKGDISAAKQSLSDFKAIGDAWLNDMKSRWSSGTFTATANKMYAEREKNAAKDKAINDELEKQRIAAGEAAAKEAAAKAKAAADEKAYQENLKLSLTAITDYSKALADMGKERLKFADERLTDKMKDEVQLYNEGALAAGKLIEPLKRYNVDINAVYNERLSIEKSALGKIGDLYEDFKKKVTLSANTKEVKAAGVEILKAYKDTAEKIIGVEQDRYNTLIAGERKYAAEVLSLINAKKQEAKDLQSYFDDLDRRIKKRNEPAAYAGGSNYEQYQATLNQLKKTEAEAWDMKDPQKRTDALKQVISAYEGMDKAIIDGQDTIVTKELSERDALIEINRIRTTMGEKVKSEYEALNDSYQNSIEKTELYQQKLLGLDNILKNMTRTITIDLRVNGMDQINRIQGFVGQATSSIGSSAPSSTVSGFGSSGGGFDLAYIPQAATGGFVQQGGLVRVHDNETIVPAKLDRTNKGGGAMTVTIEAGAIAIHAAAGADVNALSDAVVDSLARKLMPKIIKYTPRAA